MMKRIALCVGTAAAMALVPASAFAGTKAKQSMPHFSPSAFKKAAFGSFDEPPGRAKHGRGRGYGTGKSDNGHHKGWGKGQHFGWGNRGNGSGGC